LGEIWRRGWRLILLQEGLFTAAYLSFVGIRLLNPDLWQPWFGGEKMMEIAILNALARSAHMPPYDPYFAGGYLNYYYYGQFIASLPMKWTGIAPQVGFNLAVPTFFALTVSHGFGLGYHLAEGRREDEAGDGAESAASRLSTAGLWGGAATVVLVTIMGNLTGATQLVSAMAGPGLARVMGGSAVPFSFDYWQASTRVIPFTINEFPFFSFLFADLHPHMISIPFTVLAVAMILAVAQGEGWRGWGALPRGLALAVIIGALGPMNTWDVPAYWGLLVLVLALAGYRRGRWRGAVAGAAGGIGVVMVALAAYAPFYVHFQAQYVGLDLLPPGAGSPLLPFLAVWGFPLAAASSVLGLWWWNDRTEDARLWQDRSRDDDLPKEVTHDGTLRFLALPGAILLGVPLLAQGMAVSALLVPLLVIAAVRLVAGRDAVSLVQRGGLFVALGILLGIEWINMRDFLADTDWARMNTVFKFSLQAWVLLGIAAGSALPALWRGTARAGGWGRAWRGVFAVLLAASLLYPVLAVPARVQERFPGARPARNTLDGMAYMTVGQYHWPDADHPIALWHDSEAIAWLWANVPGTPVIAEAPLGYYREGGLRVSSYTGLPTLVGAHQREQRPWDQVDRRERDAEAIYTTHDVERLFGLLDRHRVRFIYVGPLERVAYPAGALAKFEDLADAGRLRRAYGNEGVVIYEVPRDEH
jgi:YYY domain-containing protein